MDLLIRLRTVYIVDESLNLSGKAVLQVEHFYTPHLALVKGLKFDASNDSRVVASALRCREKILVLVRIGIDDVSVSEDNFIIDNIVTNKAAAVGIVREAA